MTNSDLKKERKFVLLLTMIIISITSLGYAFEGTLISLSGDATVIGTKTLYEEGIETNEVVITSHEVASSGYTKLTAMDYNSTRITSGVKIEAELVAELKTNEEFEVVVHIKNNSDTPYTYDYVNISNVSDFYGEKVTVAVPRVYGMVKGNVINPGHTKDIRLIYYADENTSDWHVYNLTSNIVFNFQVGEKTLKDTVMLTSIDDSKSKFSKNNVAIVKVNVKNLYNTSYDVSFEISGSNLFLMNNAARAMNNKILFKPNEEKTISLQIQSDERLTEPITEHLFIYEGTKGARNIGTFTIQPYEDNTGGGGEPTDPDPEDPDEPEIVVIENVTATPIFTRGYNQAAGLKIDINNGNDVEYKEYVLKVYYNKTAELEMETYNQNVTSVDEDKGILTISSEYHYNAGFHASLKTSSTTSLDLDIKTNHLVSDNGNNSYTYEDLVVSKILLDAKLPDGTWSYANLIYQQ